MVTVTPEELEAVRAEAHRIHADTQVVLEKMRTELEHVRAEFTLESGTGSPDDGRMTDQDHDKLIHRMGAMTDEHVVALYLMTTDLLHDRLNGADHFLMTSIKTGFVEIAARWMPPDVFAAAWAIAYDDAEFDTSYLEPEADDA